MSYAAVGNVGFNVQVDIPLLTGGPAAEDTGATKPNCPGKLMSASGSGPPARCDGGIHAVNCKEVCCKVESWTNNTYKDIGGEISLQRLNESRIEHLFAAIFAGGGLQNMAYDLGVKPPSQADMARYNEAFTDYFRIMDKNRWVLAKGPRRGCDGGGVYDVWRTRPGRSTWTVQRVTTLEKLVGSLGGPGRAKAIDQVGVPYNQFLPPAHTAKMDELINLTMTVPGSRMGDRVGMMPTLAAAFRPQNGLLMPYGWFATFLQALRPPRVMISTALATKFGPQQQRLVDLMNQPATQQAARDTTQPAAPPPTMTQQEGGIPTAALVAGGLLVAGGVAFIALRK